MKTKFQTVKNIVFVGLVVLTSLSISHSQVITRVISPDDKIENYIPWYNPNEETPIINAPFVNVETILQADQQSGREMPRIGIKQEVNYTTEDGLLIEKGNYSIWNMTLHSENAKSMSLQFENTYLPDNAIMFLFNENSKFAVGPIRQNVFQNGKFCSDYLNGDHINITILLPSTHSTTTNLVLQIPSFDHGSTTTYAFDEDFNTSQPCNINTSCPEGNGWDCQINAVCKIIHSSIGSCTGTLVNNDCCDLTPLILTANHCTAGRPVGEFRFRFNYESPQCTPNGETTPGQWITFFGSELRANWNGTDFGLLELNTDIGGDVAFAGWNRLQNPPTNDVTCIHHPQGDVKKIAINNDGITTQGNFWLIDQFDIGLVEPGSSGSSLFDANQRSIGTLNGGDRNIGCENGHGLVDNNTFGQMSISWIGNGTVDSRLQDWLGSSTNPNTMDCMQHPFIEGSELQCASSPEIFTLINNMPCVKNVAWEVEPPNLFSSPTNGVGETATLVSNDNASGAATIRFILSSENCEDAEIEHSFWVGRPQVTTNIQYPVICIDQFEEMVIPESPGATNYQLQSLSPNIWLSTNNPTPNVPFPIIGNQLGYHQLLLTVSNACGSSSSVIYVEVVRCEGDGGGFEFRSSDLKSADPDLDVNIFPNPANEFIEIVCSDYNPGTRIAASLIFTNGKVVRTIEEYSRHFKVKMADLPSGLYVLRLNWDGTTIHKKIIKL
jgi:V8-like Glu-specific endopeptidase